MKYKVKWIEEHMGITRNMIRRYEKKGVISKNEEGKDREFDEEGLRQLWDLQSKKDVLNIVQITGELPCCLEDVIDEFGKKSE